MKATILVLALVLSGGLCSGPLRAETTGDAKALAKSLMAMMSAAHKPSRSSVVALSTDVMAAIKSRHVGLMTAWRLRGRIDAVLQSANISVGDVMNAGLQARQLLDSAGVPRVDAARIAGDVQNLVQSARGR